MKFWQLSTPTWSHEVNINKWHIQFLWQKLSLLGIIITLKKVKNEDRVQTNIVNSKAAKLDNSLLLRLKLEANWTGVQIHCCQQKSLDYLRPSPQYVT